MRMPPVSSRRRPRRRVPSKAVWCLLAALLIVAAGSLALTHLAKSYLRSDRFRLSMGKRVSERLGVEGEFDFFQWSGASVYSDGFQGRNARGERRVAIEASGIRAEVNLASWRREAWEVPSVTVQRLEVHVRTGPSDHEAKEPSMPWGMETESADIEERAWWTRWIPQRAELGEVFLEEIDGIWWLEGLPVFADDLSLRLKPVPQAVGWDLNALGGRLRVGESEGLVLKEGRARIVDEALFIEAARWEILDHATLNLQGEARWAATGAASGSRQVILRSELRDLRLDRVVQPDWRRRLEGILDGEMVSKGRLTWKEEPTKRSWTHRGSIRLRQGVFMALPLLDRLAEHTRTERFRRLVLDEASAPFEYVRDPATGEEFLDLTVSLRSDRLLRVSGKVRVNHPFDGSKPRPLNGDLLVGVARSMLKWLPGAEQRVFTEERSGFLYARMRLGGTVEAPEEDLSPRLRRAALAKTIRTVPDAALGLGQGLLGTASGLLGDLPGGRVLGEVGNQVLNQTGEVVSRGLEMVPLLEPDFEGASGN